MLTQIDTTFIAVTQQAVEVISFGRKQHWRFRLITDFQGVIERPVFSSHGDWIYIPKQAKDEAIIPKSALRRHAAIENAGFRVAQVIVGHEVQIVPEGPITSPQPMREIDWGHIEIAPESPDVPSQPKPEIDWGKVGEIAAKGLLVGIMGIAMVSLAVLTGALQLVDPSYCVVLDDGVGTVVELMRWNTEA